MTTNGGSGRDTRGVRFSRPRRSPVRIRLCRPGHLPWRQEAQITHQIGTKPRHSLDVLEPRVLFPNHRRRRWLTSRRFIR